MSYALSADRQPVERAGQYRLEPQQRRTDVASRYPMPITLLSLVILGPAAVVVVALLLVLWRERTSTRDARIAIVSGGVLSLWAVVAAVLAYRGFFQPQDAESVPPVGINLIVVLSVLLVTFADDTAGDLRNQCPPELRRVGADRRALPLARAPG